MNYMDLENKSAIPSIVSSLGICFPGSASSVSLGIKFKETSKV